MTLRRIQPALLLVMLATVVSAPAAADSHREWECLEDMAFELRGISATASYYRDAKERLQEELAVLADLKDRFADIDPTGLTVVAAIDQRAEWVASAIALFERRQRELSERRAAVSRRWQERCAEARRLDAGKARPGAVEAERPAERAGVFEWVLVEDAPMPASLKLEPPFFAKATASSGHIDLDHTVAGPSGNLYSRFAFDIDFVPAPSAVVPGRVHAFDITVTTQIADPMEKGRGIRALAYLMENDRSTGAQVALAIASCVVDWSDSDCEVVNSPPTTFKVRFPPLSEADEGDRFSYGVGVQNCGTCYVRYEYELKKR